MSPLSKLDENQILGITIDKQNAVLCDSHQDIGGNFAIWLDFSVYDRTP
jgi:hypothetical protein